MIEKGVILAGGKGTRLYPVTKIVNKHLLSVYSKPMIYYPLQTLIKAGIKKILIVLGGNNIGDFVRLLKSGEEFGVDITYRVQEKAGGIAHALALAEDFVREDNFVIILGDNYYKENLIDKFKNFNGGARILIKPVHDPERFGVVSIKDDKITKIIEKPKNPESNLAVTGCYLFDKKVFDIIKTLDPSAREELEIADVINAYLEKGELEHSTINEFWSDMGTPDSLVETSAFIKKMSNQVL